jgi:thiol-disulfide isomerase/thioredoxin
MRKILFGILILIFLFGCVQPQLEEDITDDEVETPEEDLIRKDFIDKEKTNWMNIEIKDVLTENTFKISDFKGKPILVESFAVWCPTCTKQQRETKSLHQDIGDSVISIALDTDPNEDESKVLEHANKNGFDWIYAVSPVELTQRLIDDFGIGVVNAPSAPVILICEDLSTRLLDRGVKSADTLKSEIEKGC